MIACNVDPMARDPLGLVGCVVLADWSPTSVVDPEDYGVVVGYVPNREAYHARYRVGHVGWACCVSYPLNSARFFTVLSRPQLGGLWGSEEAGGPAQRVPPPGPPGLVTNHKTDRASGKGTQCR